MARGVASDVLSVFRFHVDAVGTFGQRFLGDSQAGFASVTVPEASLETIEYREGQHTFTKKLPGVPSFDTVTLRRGVARRDGAFWDWISKIIYGNGSFRASVEIKHYARDRPNDLEAETVSIGAGSAFGNAVLGSTTRAGRIALDATPARIYRVLEAFPVRCKLAGDLDASDGNIAIAELELAYEYIEMDVIE